MSIRLNESSTVLLIGHTGMLGHAWDDRLKALGCQYRAHSYPSFDVTDQGQLDAVLDDQVDLVINCAAYTAVDQAEEDIEASNLLNGDAVGLLARSCKQHDATLVHYSTDYVFNGEATEPWPVDAAYEPVNQYGASKALGERLIAESGVDYLLIRTSWLYSVIGKNFIKTIHNASQSREALNVVNDQRGRPTWTEHLADVSIKIYESGERGKFHVCDGGECTWYELAAAIVEMNGAECVVNPCGSEEYPTPAKRPAYSVMDISRAESIAGDFPDWRIHLKQVMQQLMD